MGLLISTDDILALQCYPYSARRNRSFQIIAAVTGGLKNAEKYINPHAHEEPMSVGSDHTLLSCTKALA